MDGGEVGPCLTSVAQEIEADRFAIELLAPAPLVHRDLSGIPTLVKVIKLADNFD